MAHSGRHVLHRSQCWSALSTYYMVNLLRWDNYWPQPDKTPRSSRVSAKDLTEVNCSAEEEHSSSIYTLIYGARKKQTQNLPVSNRHFSQASAEGCWKSKLLHGMCTSFGRARSPAFPCHHPCCSLPPSLLLSLVDCRAPISRKSLDWHHLQQEQDTNRNHTPMTESHCKRGATDTRRVRKGCGGRA